MSSGDSESPNSVEASGDKSLLVCEHCTRVFEKTVNLRNHLRRMHSASHKCGKCEKRFDTQHELRKHVSVEHPHLYKCVMCEFSHRLKYQVRRHELQAHGENSVACSFDGCQLLLPYAQLRRHVRDKHSEKPVERTAMVDENMATVIGLTAAHRLFAENGSNPRRFAHLRAIAESDTFECTECDARRASRSQLMRHMARVHEKRYAPRKREKRYACTETGCARSFMTPSELDDHINVHRGEFPYECERCQRKFSARVEYGRHLKRYHGTTLTQLVETIKSTHSLAS